MLKMFGAAVPKFGCPSERDLCTAGVCDMLIEIFAQIPAQAVGIGGSVQILSYLLHPHVVHSVTTKRAFNGRALYK